MDLPYEYKDKLPHKEPEIKVDRAYNPFKDKNQPSWEALYTDVKDSSHEFPVNDHTTETQELFVDEQTTYHKTQQIQNKYILSTIKSGLVFIHQNRAHQRILYEDFLTKLSAQDSLQSQQLLFPVQIDFDQNDIRTLKTTVEYLMQIGFTFETIQEDHIILNGLPAGLDETRVQQFLEHVIEATQQDTLSEQDAMIDVLAQLLAGSSAVRVGQTLDPKAQEALVDNLFNCKEPHISPSGKPSFTTLTIEDIDKRL
ncbi:MAG: hypothetical protein CR968_03895 [Flavobacteriia bacterium]|nr:MAG: hypothetical protein CR968_03895 [Flavobacteriia bacterium]